MEHPSASDVRALYQAFPYPSPVAGDGLIRDVSNLVAFLFPAETFEGKRILDAGCGTGHRLVALAKKFPRASFLGLDLTPAALTVARELAARHGVENVGFELADLHDLRCPGSFDLIVSTGVIHHLENPERGLANLGRSLAADGHIILWLYHALGEFHRLLARELLLTLWHRETMSLDQGAAIMRDLGLSLDRERYASAYAGQDNQVLDDASINVDGYLHPIVHAYRFDQALDMLARCGMAWAAVHSVNLGNATKLIDLASASGKSLGMFCLREPDLFPSEAVRARYRQLGRRDKLKAIELVTRPNGFCAIAARSCAADALDARIQGNAIRFTM